MIPLITQQNLAQQPLTNLQTVRLAILDIVFHSVHVVLGRSVLELVQMWREIVALALEI